MKTLGTDSAARPRFLLLALVLAVLFAFALPAGAAAAPLEVSISSPAFGSTVTTANPQVVFSVTEDGSPTTVMCAIDADPPAPCSSPVQLNGLGAYTHVFSIFVSSVNDPIGVQAFTAFEVKLGDGPAGVGVGGGVGGGGGTTNGVIASAPTLGALPKSAKFKNAIGVPIACPAGCTLQLKLKIGSRTTSLPGITYSANKPTDTVSVTLSKAIKKKIAAGIKKPKKKGKKAKKAHLEILPTNSAGSGKTGKIRLK